MDVKCTGDPDFTTLAPRTELTPAQHALALPGLWTEQNTISLNLIGGHAGNEVVAGVFGATVGGGQANTASGAESNVHGEIRRRRNRAAGPF